MLNCSGKKSSRNLNAELKNVWVPKNLSLNNPIDNMGIYNNQLFYWTDKGEKAYLNFYNLNGKKAKQLEFTRGRGPGQIFAINVTFIQNEKINIFDFARRSLLIFDLKGNYIDEYKINLDDYGTIARNKEHIYFSGMLRNKLAKLDITEGDILKTIKYEDAEGIKSFRDIVGKKMKLAPIYIDRQDKKVYRGTYNLPYKIEKYDYDLNIIDKFEREIKGNFKDFKLISGSGNNGSILISSMETDDKYLYASFGGGQITERKDNKISLSGISNEYFISVFDKKNGDFLYEINVDAISPLKGITRLLKVTKENIYIMVVDFEDTLKNELESRDLNDEKSEMESRYLSGNVTRAVVTVKNPLY